MTASVVLRRRVLYADEEPLMPALAVFPHQLVAATRIVGADDVAEGTATVLAAAGLPLVRWEDEIVPRGPRPEEDALLRIPRGVGVLQLARTSHDPTERRSGVYLLTLAADHHILRHADTNAQGEDLP